MHNLLFDLYLLLGVPDADDVLTQSEITPVSSGVPNTFLHTMHLRFKIVIVFLANLNVTGVRLGRHYPLMFRIDPGREMCLINICRLHEWIMHPNFLEVSNSENANAHTYCSTIR